MDTVWWIVIFLAIELLLLIGAAAFFVRTVEKKTGKPIGEMWVDPSESMPGEGVYMIFNEDPKAFTDGQIVILKVRISRKENKRHNGNQK